MPMPLEFTPEMTQDYVQKNIIDPRASMGRQSEGRARSEAAARGLSGQAMEGSMVGLAREGTSRDTAQAIADFNYKVAGLGREERLGAQQHEWQVDEAQKNRDLDWKMLQSKEAHEDNMTRAGNIASQQGMVLGGLMQFGSKAAGHELGML